MVSPIRCVKMGRCKQATPLRPHPPLSLPSYRSTSRDITSLQPKHIISHCVKMARCKQAVKKAGCKQAAPLRPHPPLLHKLPSPLLNRPKRSIPQPNRPSSRSPGLEQPTAWAAWEKAMNASMENTRAAIKEARAAAKGARAVMKEIRKEIRAAAKARFRVTIMPKDIQLARRIRGERS